jgi:hypothetical protein
VDNHPPLTCANYEALVWWAVRGDADAAAFCLAVCSIVQCWDDLIDRDKPVSPEQINRAFWTALVEMPRNSFYRRFFDLLNPLWITGIQNWHAANFMEAGGTEPELEIAFIIRSCCADILIGAATCVGGYEWARTVTPSVHRVCHGEGLKGYKANLAKQYADAAQLLTQREAAAHV